MTTSSSRSAWTPLCVMLIFMASWRNYGPFSIPIYESVGGKSTNAAICWIISPLIHNIVNPGFFSLVFFNSVMLGAMVQEILQQNNKGHQLKHELTLFGLSILLGIPCAGLLFLHLWHLQPHLSLPLHHHQLPPRFPHLPLVLDHGAEGEEVL
ncbi:adhesion G-protein coupled receptor G1-like [Pezoporus wallicus]|uniref:adhesion G-protein coupled receptor G1-like n=1 Tax=Pezoporus wallicus TaxID=35540 RepID=UPI00254DF9C0|nr:adhesion G-protein coupled receptor G1-like [Pezoporus wallicus]